MSGELPCQSETNRDLFAWIIEQTVYPAKNPDEHAQKTKDRIRANIRFAKRLCKGNERTGVPACPIREECLNRLGRDYQLGVVAGFTDKERRKKFEAAS